MNGEWHCQQRAHQASLEQKNEAVDYFAITFQLNWIHFFLFGFGVEINCQILTNNVWPRHDFDEVDSSGIRRDNVRNLIGSPYILLWRPKQMVPSFPVR